MRQAFRAQGEEELSQWRKNAAADGTPYFYKASAGGPNYDSGPHGNPQSLFFVVVLGGAWGGGAGGAGLW